MVDTLTRNERLESKKQLVGSRHNRKLKKYSPGFNEIFFFFLHSYRSEILTFGGSSTKVIFQKDGYDCKEGFRLYEDGRFRDIPEDGISRHNNILEGIITAKKSWGLHLDMWISGICEWCFTKEEILQQFTDKNITIPEPLLKDFENRIEKKRLERNLSYYNELCN